MGMYGYMVAVPIRKIPQLIADPDLLDDVLTDDDGIVPNRISIGKSWDALHFTLTGMASGKGRGPLANAICAIDGRAIGPDLSFGPAKLLSPEQVEDVADALKKFPDATLTERYKAGYFRDRPVHGNFGADPEDLADLVELLKQLVIVRHFFVSAASRRDCVISAIV